MTINRFSTVSPFNPSISPVSTVSGTALPEGEDPPDLNKRVSNLSRLLEEAADVGPNGEDSNGCTTLMKAARVGDLVAVKREIASGTDVNFRNHFGGTALMDAAFHGGDRVVLALLEAGASAVLRNNLKATVLKPALSGGHTASGRTECLKFLLEGGAIVDYINSQDGFTAQKCANRAFHVDCERLLSEAAILKNCRGPSLLERAGRSDSSSGDDLQFDIQI